jgi:hypothetical protein
LRELVRCIISCWLFRRSYIGKNCHQHLVNTKYNTSVLLIELTSLITFLLFAKLNQVVFLFTFWTQKNVIIGEKRVGENTLGREMGSKEGRWPMYLTLQTMFYFITTFMSLSLSVSNSPSVFLSVFLSIIFLSICVAYISFPVSR